MFSQLNQENSLSFSPSKDFSPALNSNDTLENSKNTEYSNSFSNQENNNEDSFILLYEDESSPFVNLTKEESSNFEKNFNRFYVDSTKNSDGNFDNYIQSGLKLISLFPDKNNYLSQLKKIKKKIKLPPLPPGKKKTLILDLDETLIHSDFDYAFDKHDTVLKFQCDDGEEQYEKNEVPIPLILRPYVKEFLDFVSQYFELFVFTASYKDYADAILDYLEKDKKYFNLRLYREHCIVIHNCLSVKDLSIFEGQRDLKNIILVDNSIFSFARQLDNGILVTSFYNDEEDCFLGNLIYYLKERILPCEDVRTVNNEFFRFAEIKEEFEKENENLSTKV